MNLFKNKTVGVFMGGFSNEREISLRSGKAVAAGLKRQGYSVVEIDVGVDLIEKILKEKIEVGFITLHGRYGEDGAIQGLFEMLKIPYTGSGIQASAIAIDKILSKRLVEDRAFFTPRFQFFDQTTTHLENGIESFTLNFPVIVKPAREGSTIGIRKAFKMDELKIAIEEAFKIDSRVLVEELIVGPEVTAGILNGEALPIIEVVPKSGFYDFQSKYTPGATDYLIPARLDPILIQEIQETAVEIYQELGCEGCARADFMIDSEQRPYFLEINTIPGMTETSLIPKAAAHSGLSFENLVEKILNSARLKL